MSWPSRELWREIVNWGLAHAPKSRKLRDKLTENIIVPLAPPTQRQSRVIWFALTGLAVATLISLGVLAIWGLGKVVDILGPVLWPLAIAAVLACLLSPMVDIFETRRLSRTRAVLLVFAIASLVFMGVLASVIPPVVQETAQLVNKVPEYSQRIQNRINHFLAEPPALLRHFMQTSPPPQPDENSGSKPAESPLLTSATDWFAKSLPAMGGWLLKQLGTVLSSFSLIAGVALIPIYAFHFLREKRLIQSRWTDYVPVRDSSAKDEIIFVLDSISQYLVAFFRGQLLVAICNGVLYTIGFLLVGLNYAFLLGFMAVFLTMIPFLGAIIICLTSLLLAAVQYSDWQHPLMVLGVFVVAQSLESLLITPKIMGDRVGLHPLIIIVAVMTGTTLFGGLLGGLVAIPLAAALRVILVRYVWNKI
jgi:predicted PurR-regulated permease PerM